MILLADEKEFDVTSNSRILLIPFQNLFNKIDRSIYYRVSVTIRETILVLCHT